MIKMNLKKLRQNIEGLNAMMNHKDTQLFADAKLEGIKQTVEAINWTEGPLNKKGYEEWQKIKELLELK